MRIDAKHLGSSWRKAPSPKAVHCNFWDVTTVKMVIFSLHLVVISSMWKQERGKKKKREWKGKRKRKGEGRERGRQRENLCISCISYWHFGSRCVSASPSLQQSGNRNNPWSFPTLLNTLQPTMKVNIHLLSLHSPRKLFAGFSRLFSCLFQIIGHVHQNKLFSFHFLMMLPADARLLLWQPCSH